MEYEKWNEILAPYEHAVEELKIKFKNIKHGKKAAFNHAEFLRNNQKRNVISFVLLHIPFL